MNPLFCSLFNSQKSLSKYKIAITRYVIIFISIALVACNIFSKQEPTKSQIDLPNPGSLSKLDGERLRIACENWYLSVLKTKGFNGGIVVAKKGNIIFEAYNGSSHLNGLESMNDSTSLHIASVSKTFTAMATLKLWQDGKLNIDDQLSKYFPLFNYPGVTIRTLLNHRSGLPNYVHFMENMGWNKRIKITNEDVLSFLINQKNSIKNVGKPDKGFSYCNTNFALLALLIEKVSGKKYSDYLQETFFTPLQMNHTFVYKNKDSGKVTMSYDYRGKLIPFNFLDDVYGDKNIYSTPRDLLVWDRALSEGNLFNKKTLEEAYTPYSNEKPGIRNYGLGWRINNFPSEKKMIYHNGWWHGNNAAFIRLIQDSATIIVLGNKYNRGIYHAKDLASLFGNYYGASEEDELEASILNAPDSVIAVPKVSKKIKYTKNKIIKNKKHKAPVKKIAAKKIKKSKKKKSK
ncbi:MAG: class A beta-lactamase-related serine hydrolase [Chitinophagia bacterium]|nr:class A beta-lactamase-related serine hydrolase [Chitinophagia bacterium]